MKQKIGLLTCATWDGLLEKEILFAKELTAFEPNWEVLPVVWNDETIDWAGFDVLIFRTIWDYFRHPVAFNLWLDKIEKLGIKTFNSIETVRKNHHKFYLRDLENKGIDIVPTFFLSKGTPLDGDLLRKIGSEKAILKPAISAGSHETRLFSANEADEVAAQSQDLIAQQDLLLQPFLEEIKTAGEVSMLFFNGQFSHAVVKTPVSGDFRIQVQYGGKYVPYAADAALIETGRRVVTAFSDETLLYARVDGVLRNGRFLLMELELIEPDLYFDFATDGKQNYFKALKKRLSPPQSPQKGEAF
jgi:glutathione synthase/RimK-type ligase-like ATP-grasp enzyme